MSTHAEVQIVLDWQCEVVWPDQPSEPEAWLADIIAATVRRVGLRGIFEVSLVITDDRRMRRINRQFRGIDKTTDVLSFPQSSDPLLALPSDQRWVARAMGDDTHNLPVDTPPLHRSGEEAGGRGQPYAAPSLNDPPLSSFAGEGARGRGQPYIAPSLNDPPLSSFAGEGARGRGQPYHLGDIMISAPTVARQAAAAGHRARWECAFLVAHGTLHLLGYDDYFEAGYRAMVAHQEAVLAELGIKR